ncbi:Soluble secreted antigen MPT53 precursor [Nocardioides dokdonensis FR1436]|uniref:Soluble secreted antigen MPT53 n=1 Tax=Nocardioides dokdonensis FR1436 TaxID=1300347 RepID=A0A1A9GS23_9ACTN|nr:redoxin family protein [Nocardioides dokdonensis]ANH40402.1 Soluble secreted antigen MPT53 precursor [Nocardioides dokdonensis FR1436]
MTTPRLRPGPAVASLLAAAALVLSACGTTSTGSSASTDASGDNALYDVSARTVSGADWDGATLSGRPAVLWFWAPWCPTCRAQISGVGALAQTHGDDVAVVGVGAEDDASAIAEFASEVDPAVTNLSDVDGAVWRHFGVTAQSTYLVLDAEGDVRGEGYLDDAELADLVEELVDEQAG